MPLVNPDGVQNAANRLTLAGLGRDGIQKVGNTNTTSEGDTSPWYNLTGTGLRDLLHTHDVYCARG